MINFILLVIVFRFTKPSFKMVNIDSKQIFLSYKHNLNC